MGRPRILFVCPRYPYPPLRGDQVRSYNLIRVLSRRAEITVLCFGSGPQLPDAAVEVRGVRPRIGGRALANLRHPRADLPGQVRLHLDAGMERALGEELDRLDPDVVHLTLARMGPYMPSAGSAHRHLDLTDSLSMNMATRARGAPLLARAPLRLEAWTMRRYEAGLVASADSCSVVSAADRAVSGLGGAVVIPNGVDRDAFPFVEPSERRPRALFFGNLGYFHNVEPATYLARRVAPLLCAANPEAELRIVGARPGRAVRQLADLNGVSVAADVVEMASELHGAAVSILPSFSGSGIKNKVLESFCAGLPVIANRLGVQGVEGAEAGVHYIAAEAPAAMAEAALWLFDDPAARLRLARAAGELIEARYTWGAQGDRLAALYGGRLA